MIVTRTRFAVSLAAACAVVALGCRDSSVLQRGASADAIPPASLNDPLPAQAGADTVTPEWLLSHIPKRNLAEVPVEWTRDGRLLVTLPDEAGTPRIESVDTASGARTVLTDGDGPVASRDGSRIALVRSSGGVRQLWTMRPDGRELRQLTRFPKGLQGLNGFSLSYAWSPDGSRLALTQQPYTEGWQRGRAAVADTMRSSAVEGQALTIPPADGEIWLVDATSGEATRLMSAPFRASNISWFSDGSEVVIGTGRSGREYNDPADQYHVVAVRVSDGTRRTLAAPVGMQQALDPALSPDGRQVVFSYDAENPYDFLPSLGLAATRPAAGDSAPPITQLTRETRLFAATWAPDGKRIYARRTYGGYRQIYAVDASSGAMTQLTRGALDIANFALSADGSRLAWSGVDAHGRVVVRIAGSDGANSKDLLVFPGPVTGVALSEVREIEWKAREDGLTMRGLLVLPLGYREGTRYPLIVDIHGGGGGSRIYFSGGLLVRTPVEWQMWAAKGYAVLVPDYRATGSYGSQAIRDMRERQSGDRDDMNDVLGGVDHLIADGIADSTRMAVIGHSAGAYRANWLTVRTHMFRAIVSKDGWADNFYRAGITPSPTTLWLYGGTPTVVPEKFTASSAIYHARGATTPTLFLMGNPDLGGVDTYESVRFLHNALKEQGVPTTYVVYPDEGHVFSRSANRRDVVMRTIEWIDRHFAARQAAHR